MKIEAQGARHKENKKRKLTHHESTKFGKHEKEAYY
jgi:hypothetical protein